MEKYTNRNGKSGVESYEIAETSITVKFFSDGSKYLYSYKSPGAIIVAKMKALAVMGKGLNAYINSVVKKNYEKKY